MEAPMTDRRRTFAPWRGDFVLAACSVGLAIFAMYGGVRSGTAAGTAVGVGFAGLLAYAARRLWMSGYRRWFGANVEQWAIAELGKRLDRKRITWTANARFPGVGDIDVLVEKGPGRRAIVEIKSFVHWEQSLGRLGAREKAAIEQAGRQAAVAGAAQITVWLPRGRPTLLQRVFGAGRGDVRVVFGGAHRVARRIKRL